MLDKFLHHISQIIDNKSILITVSGGIDSMVLLYLLKVSGNKIEVLHVDHNTRNNISHHDAKFIEQYCCVNKVPFHLKTFVHTQGNFQNEARLFRIAESKKILKASNLDLIATAHHYDDLIEGFFLAATRGSGLRGLTGFKAIDGNFIKPFLTFKKQEIVEFAKTMNIPFVEDESNASINYSRNFVRNEIIPLLRNRDIDFDSKIQVTLDNLNQDYKLLEYFVAEQVDEVSDNSNDNINIDLNRLEKGDNLKNLLFHYLRKYGFNADQVDQCLSSNTGSLIFSETHIINKDRNFIRLKKISKDQLEPVKINFPGQQNWDKSTVEIIELDRIESSFSKGTLLLDADKVSFPLTLRMWEAGDTFQPAGMEGKHKKVKKYLTDIKRSRLDKNETAVLEFDGKIICIVGLRPDERFKATENTKRFLKVSISH